MVREQDGLLNNNYIHGETNSLEYKSWQSMKARCYDPNNGRFRYYGHRGIVVCERWLNSFPNFLDDMGRRPTRQHTLGRKNNDGNYELANCEWQTQTKQNRNRSITKLTLVEAREVRMIYNHRGYTQEELAQEFGVSRSTISHIVNRKRWQEGKE